MAVPRSGFLDNVFPVDLGDISVVDQRRQVGMLQDPGCLLGRSYSACEDHRLALAVALFQMRLHSPLMGKNVVSVASGFGVIWTGYIKKTSLAPPCIERETGHA